MYYILAIFLLANNVYSAQEQAPKEKQVATPAPRGRQLPFFNSPNQQFPYPNEAQYDPYLNQQLPYNGYYPNVQSDNQGYPVQPQVLYYATGGSGQPFLINPGSPPGNFLVPQQPQFPQQPQPFPQQPQPFPQQPQAFPQQPQPFPQQPQPFPQQPQPFPQQPGFDPNVYRNQPFPQGPIFIAGYPKPAHIPPTDKDAEEIPTDPKQVPQQKGKKPEKIELDEAESDKPETGKAEPKRPKNPTRNFVNLRPGQRFFFLNGQPIFANYPVNPFQQGLIPERYSQGPYFVRQNQPIYQQPFKPNQNLFLRNAFNTANPDVKQGFREESEKPGVLLRDILPFQLQNQYVNKEIVPVVLKKEEVEESENLQSRYYEKGLPNERDANEGQTVPIYEGNVHPGIAYDYYRYNDQLNDNDAVVIDAKDNYEQDPESDAVETDADTEKPAESSVAQAQPGAIALAGVGGVAAAGPRGTALAGEGGLAVSSPHATAVAGPSKDGEEEPVKKASTTKKSKQ